MYQFIHFFLYHLLFALLFVACFLALFLLTVKYLPSFLKKKGISLPVSARNPILLGVAMTYGAFLLYATFLRSLAGYVSQDSYSYNIHLFQGWMVAWNQMIPSHWLNLILNIGLFLPLGILLPLLHPKFQKGRYVVLSGFGLSLSIELIQLLTGLGFCDVDDLFCNTLGAFFGWCFGNMFRLFRSKEEQWLRKIAVYATAPALFCVCLLGVFGFYLGKEYGNLPYAATFTVNTKKMQWDLDCELLPDCSTAYSYRIPPFNAKDCKKFADEFAQKQGCSFSDCFYTDDGASFADPETQNSLWINYSDHSYEYSIGSREPSESAPELDEADVIERLEQIGISLPKKLNYFHWENGRCQLSVYAQKYGNTLVSGNIDCTFAADGSLCIVSNHLIVYDLYKQESIISSEEAYLRLMGGELSLCEWFPIENPPSRVTTIHCEPSFRLDTKGIFQPVYQFFVTWDGCESPAVFFIPARA